jgi:two-component system, LuxR family, response regulator FixJ
MIVRKGFGLSDASPLIHIVDDDPSVVQGLSRLLRSWGMRVRTFGSGEEFLNALTVSPDADCSLIDVQMPGMTGLQVQDALNRSGMDMPIIFITAHRGEGIELQAMKAGAVGFLRKPFSDDVLVGLIRKATQGRRKPKPCTGVESSPVQGR